MFPTSCALCWASFFLRLVLKYWQELSGPHFTSFTTPGRIKELFFNCSSKSSRGCFWLGQLSSLYFCCINQQSSRLNPKGTEDWIPLPESHRLRANNPGCAARGKRNGSQQSLGRLTLTLAQSLWTSGMDGSRNSISCSDIFSSHFQGQSHYIRKDHFRELEWQVWENGF